MRIETDILCSTHFDEICNQVSAIYRKHKVLYHGFCFANSMIYCMIVYEDKNSPINLWERTNDES